MSKFQREKKNSVHLALLYCQLICVIHCETYLESNFTHLPLVFFTAKVYIVGKFDFVQQKIHKSAYLQNNMS